MPDDNAREWVVEPPPGPGEISLFVAVGDGVVLTEEQEAALGAFVDSLEAADSEVAGFGTRCPKQACTCPSLYCSAFGCGALVKSSAVSTGGWSLTASFGTA